MDHAPIKHESFLPSLASDINEQISLADKRFDDAKLAASDAVTAALRAGYLLLQAKETVGHGNFVSWCEENIEATQRSAQRYLKLANKLKNDTMSFLPNSQNTKELENSEMPDNEAMEVDVIVQPLNASSMKEAVYGCGTLQELVMHPDFDLWRENGQVWKIVAARIREATGDTTLNQLYKEKGIIRQPKRPKTKPVQPKASTPPKEWAAGLKDVTIGGSLVAGIVDYLNQLKLLVNVEPEEASVCFAELKGWFERAYGSDVNLVPNPAKMWPSEVNDELLKKLRSIGLPTKSQE